MVRYNMVLDIAQIGTGPQMAIKDSFSYIIYAFYSRYNMVWIANTEIGLDPKNSVIKRLWYTWKWYFEIKVDILHKNVHFCIYIILEWQQHNGKF